MNWLVVNYKYFCNGLVEKDEQHKDNFLYIVHAKDKIQIYNDKLKLGSVSYSWLIEQRLRLPPPKSIHTKFMRETTRALVAKWFKMEESASDCPDSTVS